MALLDELAAENRPKVCPVARVKGELGDDAADLDTALSDLFYSLRAIHTVLTARGLTIGRESLAKHRRGECLTCQ